MIGGLVALAAPAHGTAPAVQPPPDVAACYDGTSRFGSGSGTLAVHVLEISGSTARLEITTTLT